MTWTKHSSIKARCAPGLIAPTLLGIVIATSIAQTPTGAPPDENAVREYSGTYQWANGGFVYLQIWGEFSGKNQLVAFDESGEVRVLYLTDHDRFFTGPGVAVSSTVEITA